MTSWGCAPTCRGFDHAFFFFNAFNDYFTHEVGGFLDFRNDTVPVPSLNGSYFTEVVTADVIRWLRHTTAKNASQPTFAYVVVPVANGLKTQFPIHLLGAAQPAQRVMNRISYVFVCGLIAVLFGTQVLGTPE